MSQNRDAGDSKDHKIEISQENFNTSLDRLYESLLNAVSMTIQLYGDNKLYEKDEIAQSHLSKIPLILETIKALDRLKKDSNFNKAKIALESLRIEVEEKGVYKNTYLIKKITNFYKVLDPLTTSTPNAPPAPSPFFNAPGASTPSSQVPDGKIDKGNTNPKSERPRSGRKS